DSLDVDAGLAQRLRRRCHAADLLVEFDRQIFQLVRHLPASLSSRWADQAPILGAFTARSGSGTTRARGSPQSSRIQHRSSAISPNHRRRRIAAPTFEQGLEALGIAALVTLEYPMVPALQPPGTDRWRVRHDRDSGPIAGITK